MAHRSSSNASQSYTSKWQIFLIFLRLGFTSFGGPVAHLGYFRQEFVHRRQWLCESAFSELVALCQFLPGPASSQVGIALGLSRGGIGGALLSWLGFTLPSALMLLVLGLVITRTESPVGGSWLHGLKIAAVAVVAQALWGMAKSLCPDKQRIAVAVIASALVTWMPNTMGQFLVILMGAFAGWQWLRLESALPVGQLPIGISQGTGLILLLILLFLLLALPAFAQHSGIYAWQSFDRYFRTGAMVFGGGHVVLPLLYTQLVSSGWVDKDLFLAGYGAAQAVPGPLFTLAAYLGCIATVSPNGIVGGVVALVAIFLPSFLLVLGVLPLWDRIRHYPAMQRAMSGINAAVVGLLLSALYHPVWTGAVHSARDFSVVVLAYSGLAFMNLPSWLVVFLCAAGAGLGWA